MKYLKFILLGILVFGLLESCSANNNIEVSQKPNIVLILTDDLGYGDLSSYGATQYKTPNIDLLANKGIRFTNFYAAQPVCSASRAALLTGCYSNRVGIKYALGPGSKTGLNPEEETIAEILKHSNYKTIAIGKWHLGDHFKFLPLQHGFDEFLGLPYSNDMWPVGYDGNRKMESNYPELPLMLGNKTIREIKTLKDQSQLTTLYTDKATSFIEENSDQPFFLYLSHTMPHVPLAVSEKFRGTSEQGLFGDVIREIDWSVGEIVKTLKKNGIRENTLIVFTSDNGPWLSYGNHAGSTGGMREGKLTSFEGGVRVPCIMQWPDKIPEGEVCNKIASLIDVLPTLAHITDSPLPKKKIDGVNIYPLLEGDTNANPREIFYYYFEDNELQAIRMNHWKLVFPHDYKSYEGVEHGKDGYPGEYNNKETELKLFNLRYDPGERYDVSLSYPEVVEEMKLRAQDARNDLGDSLTGEPGKNRRQPGRLN